MTVMVFDCSIHLCVTLVHTKPGVADRFVKDVRECTAEIMSDPKADATGQVSCALCVMYLNVFPQTEYLIH